MEAIGSNTQRFDELTVTPKGRDRDETSCIVISIECSHDFREIKDGDVRYLTRHITGHLAK